MEAILKLDTISKAMFDILKENILKDWSVLEFGSSTGHISFHFLADGHKVDLLDIRKAPIEQVKKTFGYYNINTNFYIEDFLLFQKRYDFLWNSGCIQCCNDAEKNIWIAHCSKLAPRLILFWPDKTEEQRDVGRSRIKGFDHAQEYDTSKVEAIMLKYYLRITSGRIENTGLPYTFMWAYGSQAL